MNRTVSEHDGDSPRPARIAFVMEQHVGHRTYSDNLRHALSTRDDVVATWVPVDYTSSGTWLERIPITAVQVAMRGRAQVRRGLRGVDFDAALFNTQVPAVLGGRPATRRPYVLCTDVTPLQYDAMASGYSHHADRGGLVTRWKHRRNRRVMQGASAHAPWSRWTAASLVADYGVDPQRIEVIPPGVDMARWTPGDRSLDGPMQLLFVGGEFERKGGKVLLEAFAALPEGSAELSIVSRDPVPRQAGVRVYDHLSPNDDELMALYRRSHVFVLPSLWETFGIAAVEAGASGLAIVATTVGGLEELVVEGHTGFHVGIGSVDDLARRLRELSEAPELRARLGAAARARAITEFDASINAERLIRVAIAGAQADR